MIEVSKLQGDLLEDKKELIVHTEAYHKNRELKNFTENRILKQTQETVGQLLFLTILSSSFYMIIRTAITPVITI